MSDTKSSSTSERILEAAIAEFSEFGFAGARVDRIAKRAQCNKQLLYHHYGGKEELCRVVLRQEMTKSAENMAEMACAIAESGGGLINLIMNVFDEHNDNPQHVRLALWERLDFSDDEVLEEEERRELLHSFINELLHDVDEDLRPHLALIVFSLATMPYMGAQFTQLLTGHKPTDPEFRSTYLRALRQTIKGDLLGTSASHEDEVKLADDDAS
ncbi:MAG: TetR/AcrR family transcriptional regulator [Myxococcota bacterium]